jgi:hypothetical protein
MGLDVLAVLEIALHADDKRVGRLEHILQGLLNTEYLLLLRAHDAGAWGIDELKTLERICRNVDYTLVENIDHDGHPSLPTAAS